MIEQVGAGAAYRAYVVVGLLIIVAQLAVIVWLFTQRAVRRRIADGAPAAHSVPALAADNHAILRAIPDVMFVLSREGTYLDYHARDHQMLFAPPEAFLGRNVRDVMPPNLARMFLDALERAVQSDDPVVVEYELPMKSPRLFEARLVYAERDRVLSIVRDITELKRAHELNQQLAGRLIASQEEERQRIARELHDDLSQELALLNIEIDHLVHDVDAGQLRDRLKQMSKRAGAIASDVHDLCHELHPSRLQTLGLLAAIGSLCRDVARQRSILVDFTHDGELPQPMDADLSLCVYRITQEALHNVAKHSRARMASVRLASSADDLSLYVADAGVGFDLDGTRAEGLGLASMRERVGFLKGRFVIHTSPGQGTRLGVRIPLRVPDVASQATRWQSA
jgi:signal transduction histidine kinase